jgi:hypothetical protein
MLHGWSATVEPGKRQQRRSHGHHQERERRRIFRRPEKRQHGHHRGHTGVNEVAHMIERHDDHDRPAHRIDGHQP